MMVKEDCLSQVAEVAQMLWDKGWAERNGGNIVVRLQEDTALQFETTPLPFGCEVPNIAGLQFYCKGSGSRMRDLARNPMKYGCIIKILPDGKHYLLAAGSAVKPTSEIAAHLLIHNYLVGSKSEMQATLHTHPSCLVAMSHHFRPATSEAYTSTLHSMIPEARLFVPRGIGFTPYLEPGSAELAEATLTEIITHDIVLWNRHGTLAAGTTLIDAFDYTDIMEKSADIYIKSCIVQKTFQS